MSATDDATDERPLLASRLDDLFRTVRPGGGRWTNTEVADELKRADPGLRVGGVYLSQLRTGRRSNPSPDLLAALARFFGVSVAHFFDEEARGEVRGGSAEADALRQAGIRALVMRADGMRTDNLRVVTDLMDRYRRMEGLPPVTEQPDPE
ncbi:XRE family transcriptional regulator [Streptomyces sp. NPDC057939]|uniref:XRE family transcriptional regulator n=1 Tax=Streptomyces sp. NPDC057939 TaxID=3346284 RepID=UPI0036EBD3FF